MGHSGVTSDILGIAQKPQEHKEKGAVYHGTRNKLKNYTTRDAERKIRTDCSAPSIECISLDRFSIENVE